MKVWICFALIAVVCAKEFEVKKNNATCAMLTVSGSIELKAMKGSTQEGSTVTLKFDDAALVADSSCEDIRLDMMNQTVQVGFKMSGSAEQSVTPTAQFIPKDVFGDQVNISDTLMYEASPLGNFMKNESFRCMAPVNHNFSTTANLTTYTYSVVATTTDFQVQFSDIVNGTFSDGQDCNADKTTVAPVTKTSTSTTPSPSTPKPKPKPRFVVTEGNKTCVIMDGNLALAIPYNATSQGKTVLTTAHVMVPNTSVANGTCDTGVADTTQKLSIFFNKDWEMHFMFDQEDSGYYISNIEVTYDSAGLPNATETGRKTVSYNGTKNHYMLASKGGYYQCNSNISVDLNGVMLSSSDFKYAASETNATYSGSITECSEDEETSSVVPIAVGAALAGLVVIVLIAYLIGRRRSRAAGYESV